MAELDDKAALDRFLAENSELEQLSARLATFNLFDALRIAKAEIRHSNTLAWLLDPAESHGLGDVFLRRILSNILLGRPPANPGISAAQVELMDMSDVEVRREWKNIDILVVIRSRQNVILLIENKIGSGESREQLSRYRKTIDPETMDREFASLSSFVVVPVFLTLEGQASEDEEASDFIPYSHSQLLTTVARLVDLWRQQLPQAVGVFLDHYLATLRRLTMQDKTLMDLCKTIYRKHRQAIDLIVKYGMENRFQQIACEVLEIGNMFERLSVQSNAVWFLPNSWTELVPENGTVWKHLNRPVSVVGQLYRGNKDVWVYFLVTGMDDPELRRACVRGLRDAGFALGKKASDKDAKLSIFFRHKHPVNDMDDEGQVRDGIEKVLAAAKVQLPKIEGVLKTVFQ